MRCRTLARDLQRRGAEVCFICRRQPGDLIHLLQREFAVLALPNQPLVSCEGSQGRELYLSWLGCTQAQDASHCLEVLANAGINSSTWVVVDHYSLDARWEEQLLAGLSRGLAAPKLLVIDDLADRTHVSDLILDQNFFGKATSQRYLDLVPSKCCHLLGPHYALLGPEYFYLHPLVPPRSELRRVLVFFGGVDQDNLCGLALEALMDPLLTDIAVDVVLGPQSPHRLAIEKLSACRDHTTLYGPLPSLAGLIARADLAIGAGGSTTWERICLGLHSLVVATADNQLPSAIALDQAGYIQLLGDVRSMSANLFYSSVLKFIRSPLPQPYDDALVDGRGTSLLTDFLLLDK